MLENRVFGQAGGGAESGNSAEHRANLTRILPSEKERFPALLRRIFLFSCKLEAR